MFSFTVLGLNTKIVKTSELNTFQTERMFELLTHYYDVVDYQQFLFDLKEKSHTILLRSRDGRIQGFSTLLVARISNGKTTATDSALGIFSGDTVLEKAYWGNGDLAMAFGRFLFLQKLKHPLTEIYWFLISKGYKTYLLMANNFPAHYPRYERATPKNIQNVMDHFYRKKYNANYDSGMGLVRFDINASMKLKEKVADIDVGKLNHPRIRFFNDRNPDWKNGTELACVAKVTLAVPFYYLFKYLRKQIVGRQLKALGILTPNRWY